MMCIEILAHVSERDSRLDHREVKRFVTRLPIGWGLVRKMRTFDLIETEPVLVKFDLFKVPPVGDNDLAALRH